MHEVIVWPKEVGRSEPDNRFRRPRSDRPMVTSQIFVRCWLTKLKQIVEQEKTEENA
jgi:hypothetical protein